MTLSVSMQAKVLTVIEDHKLRRVGGNKAIPVDARIIAATQRDLKQMASQGLFREDLYHRLDLFRVSIPPLRYRGEDIVELAEWMLQSLCRKHSLPQKQFTPAGRERLLAYHWPGNVRELAHELERALVFEEAAVLDFAQLPAGAAGTPVGAAAPADWLQPGFVFPDQGFALEDAINRLVQLALQRHEYARD